jgi:YbbR domain-containing protein
MKTSQKGISENASYKVVALLITLILWVIILGSKEAAIVKMIPTNYILPRDMVITNSVPGEVAFRLTGPRLPLKRFSENVEPLAMDLSSALEGSTTIRIHPDSVDVPPGIRVISVTPATITAKIEKLVTVKVPVEVDFKGELPSGHKLGKVTLSPAQVEITAYRSAAEKIKKIKTETLDLASIETSVTRDVSLVLDEPGIVKKGSPQVHLNLEVTPK